MGVDSAVQHLGNVLAKIQRDAHAVNVNDFALLHGFCALVERAWLTSSPTGAFGDLSRRAGRESITASTTQGILVVEDDAHKRAP